MKRERKQDPDDLDQREDRQLLDFVHRVIEGLTTPESGRVGPQVHDEKHSDGEHPREGMKTPQQERASGRGALGFGIVRSTFGHGSRM